MIEHDVQELGDPEQDVRVVCASGHRWDTGVQKLFETVRKATIGPQSWSGQICGYGDRCERKPERQ